MYGPRSPISVVVDQKRFTKNVNEIGAEYTMNTYSIEHKV